MTKEQKDRLQKAEDLLSEASTLIDGVSTELNETANVDPAVHPMLDDAYEGAYGAMCSLANLRCTAEKV